MGGPLRSRSGSRAVSLGLVCAAHNTVGEVEVGTANISSGSPSDQDFYIEVFK